MTNAEKYLKEGADVENMATEMVDFFNFPPCEGIGESDIEDFFKKEAKPTLTEDERVILRNVDKEWITIARPFKHNLELRDTLPEADKIIKWSSLEPFNHLFQFIKERRRIRDKGAFR